MALELKSPDFENGKTIPAEFTCDGEDASPALQWSGAPEQTKSFALIMDDPDAPMGDWVHWVVYDIPASELMFPKGRPKSEMLNNGAKQGIQSFRAIGYGGPCPPPGRAHRYLFRLYALDAMLDLDPGASKEQVEEAMKGHILASSELMGLYGRSRR